MHARKIRIAGRIGVALAAVAGAAILGPTGSAAVDTGVAPVPGKITAELRSLFEADPTQDFWVRLSEHADNAAARVMSDWNARGTRVAANLRETADRSQAPVREVLDDRNIPYESFWVSNAVKVEQGTAELADDLAAMPGVAQLFPPVEYAMDDLIPGVEQPKVDGVEWGIADINADDVWEQYDDRGEGIVIANIDTGVQYDHPALVEHYRGNLGGGEFDNNYNWFDAAGTGSDFPVDSEAHGTHTMGTMVGDDGGDNQIGVAPGATWIASNGCCPSDSAMLGSMQWMLEPLDLEGENPDASKRPNIVSNSWGVSSEPTDPFGDDIQQAWIDSGIFATWSNRNYGPACDTTGSPGGRALSYSSGAYDINGDIAYFSSRGPGEDGMIKPNISGPGVDVRSSIPGGGYTEYSGTSMSTPHTAGVVALLWSAAPSLIGDIEATRKILNESASDVDDTSCGGTPENNNVFGEGRLDALAALELAPVGETGEVAGSVIDSTTNEPVEGATVTFSGTSDREFVTDADGTFAARLTAGPYDVEVSAFGYETATVETEVVEDETLDLVLPLEPAESYRLSGRVRDRFTGDRLAGVAVAIVDTPLMTMTNARGGYHFHAVPTGEYRVTVTPDRCHLARTKPVVIDGIWPKDGSLFKGDERKRFRARAIADEAGYTCSTERSDYQKADTALPLRDDEKLLTVDLPFDFPYYGETYSSADISTNGHLRFVPSKGAAFENTALPDPERPNGVVAVFWDDLMIDAASAVRMSESSDAVTFEWHDALIFGGSSRIDFEVTLYANGEVLMAYKGLEPGVGAEAGESATIGIENADGTIGRMYSMGEAVLNDDTAVRFRPGA